LYASYARVHISKSVCPFSYQSVYYFISVNLQMVERKFPFIPRLPSELLCCWPESYLPSRKSETFLHPGCLWQCCEAYEWVFETIPI
jgi:hypothetical protein